LNPTVVLLTRDLRVHDQPALAAAVERGGPVVPLFVLDERLLGSFGAPNRVAFLLDALRDLRGSLEELGGGLAVRRGDTVTETVRVALGAGAGAVTMSEDVSAYAQARQRRLDRALAGARISLNAFPGVTVVPPGDVAPHGADHFKVFTPYWRRWRDEQRRPVLAAPARLQAPEGFDWGVLPELPELQERWKLTDGATAPELPQGGERAGRARLDAWLADGLAGYPEGHDDLGGNRTSRLSPYLHFGCVSPLEVVERSVGLPGGEEFVRQLCWRDFHHQLLAARPELSHEDMRPRVGDWDDDAGALAAWQEGRTGYPLVDAGMRQLLREGWMHNRARLTAGSFLTKHLGIDWRAGADHFFRHLVDGDVANNALNWQWVGGTGADTRPYRRLNPFRQAERFDPDGVYVRRYLPELGTPAYPPPIAPLQGARRLGHLKT
jgi:deoxyribodipyrimidine photo-lyase